MSHPTSSRGVARLLCAAAALALCLLLPDPSAAQREYGGPWGPGYGDLQQYLPELSSLQVKVYREDRRTLLPASEACISCPWEVRMELVRDVLNRARVPGEVVLSLADSRGATVVELGRYSPDRAGVFSSVPSSLMVPFRGRMEGSSLCGLTLRMANGQGAVAAEGPTCAERGW
jgi:hypothetical protein